MQYIVFYILIFSIGSFFYLSSIKDELISLRNEVITMSNKQEPAKKVKNNKYPKGLTRTQHKARIETPIDLRKYKYFPKAFGEYVRDISPTKQQYQIEGSKRGILGEAMKDAMYSGWKLWDDRYADSKEKRERLKKITYGSIGNNVAYDLELNPDLDPTGFFTDASLGYGDGSSDYDLYSFENAPGVIANALKVPYTYANEDDISYGATAGPIANSLVKSIIKASDDVKNEIMATIQNMGGDTATFSDLLREAIGSNMKIDNANAFLDFIKGYQFNDPRLAEMAEKYSQYEYDPNYVEGAEGTTEDTNPSGYILDTSSADAIRKAMYGDTYGQALQSTKPVVNYNSGLTDEEAYRIGREMAIGVHGGR